METSAKILADSRHPVNGSRLTTFELTYWRAIHSELLTHRKFSRNSASSRAIPTPVLLRQVEEHPFIPQHFGKLQKGMQAFEELEEGLQKCCESTWLIARDQAVRNVNHLYELKLHKQIANRLLEPWMWITVIVTSDDRGLQNFFRLRVDPMAEPHIQKLACMMFNEYRNNQPVRLAFGDWHIPFVSEEELDQYSIEDCIKKSVARCARGSYLQHNGDFSFEDDVALGEKLSTCGHWSPFEHQAMCTQSFNMGGNFCDGWLQNRKRFVGEHGCEENFEALEELILDQHEAMINRIAGDAAKD